MAKIGKTCKEYMVKEISEKLKGNPSIFVTDCTGLNVSELGKLRTNLKGIEASYVIIKNSMSKLALRNTKQETLASLLEGTIGLALGGADPIVTSKALVKFSRDSGKLRIKGGMLDGKLVTEADIKQLSQLPSREILLAICLGAMKAPVTGFVNILGGVIRKFVFAINAIREKKEKHVKS